MKCRVKWLDHMSFVGESDSGHSVVMDSSVEAGGRDLGVRPMEMLLLGLGGCTAIDVVSILHKSRQQIVDCEVEIEAERAAEIPMV
ncbi:MAG: OsmC family protein, partial [Gammaproteobacteria bacterium]|nr:OsmC family protein [Gammaproteobacteria bacterium]